MLKLIFTSLLIYIISIQAFTDLNILVITDSNYGYKHHYGDNLQFKEYIADAEPNTVETGNDSWTTDDDPFGDVPSATPAKSESPFEDDLFG